MHKSPKRQCFFAKQCSFWSFFSIDEGQLYANCLLYIPATYPKCHRFHFFIRGIGTQISILTVVQNKTKSHRKDSVFLLKNVVLKVLFRDEGYVYAKYLSNSLTILS